MSTILKTIERSSSSSCWSTHTGNQLLKATDAIGVINIAESADFKDFTNQAVEYTFNKNGAMTKDLNKGITKIEYNSLNLPKLMDIKSPLAEARKEYTYTASGAKLQVVSKWNPNFSTNPVIGSDVVPTTLTKTKTTDYVGNIVYEDNALKRILVDGGYIEGGLYNFYLTDHLGNNRAVAKADASIIQRTQFYPFGAAFADGLSAGLQPYKYNGKELDAEHGVNWYDYSARQKSDFGFTSVDPLAEKYYSTSPYVYCLNNPLKYIDPTGMDTTYVNPEGGAELIVPGGEEVIMPTSDEVFVEPTEEGSEDVNAYVIIYLPPPTQSGRLDGLGANDPLFLGLTVGKSISTGALKALWNILNQPRTSDEVTRNGFGGKGKGERNYTGSASGTKDPFKHMKPDPNKPGNVLVKNPQTGKTVSKPAPPGYIPPVK